jgi:hypothetical protein
MQDEKLPLGAKISAVIAIGLGVLITQHIESKQKSPSAASSQTSVEQRVNAYTNQTALDFEFKEDHWFPDYTARNYQPKYN